MFWNNYPRTDFHELNADWIIAHFKEFMEFIKHVDNWIDEHENDYEELKKLYDDIISGNFPPDMYHALHEWIVRNSVSIISSLIKSVFFVLEDGYLVAYIPDSWSDITFGTTGLDDFIAGYDFGHLTLTY